ncbi:MAG TPA: PAS domain-containing protein [Polyangiaceae bacterium]
MLRESEERFRALASAAREAILIHEQGVVREVNHAFSELLGYTREEIVDQDGMIFIAPEDRDAVRESMMVPSGTQTSIVTLITKSGERRYAESSSHPIVFYGRPMRVVTIQDFTARRVAEAELERSHARLMFALDAVTMGAWDYDVATDQAVWTPQIYKIFGLEPGSFSGKGADWIGYVHPADRERVASAIAAAKSGATLELQFEHRVVHAGGGLRWVECRGRTFVDRAGKPATMAGICIDITRRHELEEQLMHSQRMEATGRLAGGIAHDFNNLLTVILSYSELARLSLNPEHSAIEPLEQISSAAQRASSLTRQLLIFARKEVVNPKVIDINRVVENVGKLLRRVVGEDIALSIEANAEQSTVLMDVVQCEQLLMNLAVNARDAMPHGGRLGVCTRSGPSGKVELEVSDSGVGMPQEVRERAFEPFFTTKSQGKGTGLGLSTCLAIVTRAGGTIAIASELGKGTTFHIELPCTALALESVGGELASFLPRGSETVLLIEDDPAVRQLTARILRAQGYTVLVATHGDEAIEVASHHPSRIDLFLSDVVMPGSSGPSVIEQLSQGNPHAKVLFVSGYTGSEFSRMGLDAASFQFLPKPYSTEELARRVRQVLDE